SFLPPVTAAQFEISRNIYVGTLGALIWDMLVTLPEEIWLLTNGISPAIVSYFLSRYIFPQFNILRRLIGMPNCMALEHAITSCWVLATASTGFLFLRRVQALYLNNRIVSYFFIFLYITNAGVSIVTPIGSRVTPLADTGYCINGGIAHYVSATVFMTLAYDTMVFLAISYKVATEHGKPGRPVNLKSLITGEAFPRFSRAILQGGQQYYLITVCLNILISVLIVAPSVPPIYEAIFTVPDIAVTSSMACRVYRNLRLAG
ncbi:hypothetical protein M422DRAFT_95821, partial [Sphaerobolus stellatus SS14]